MSHNSTINEDVRHRTATFASLHYGSILVLPNAWDVGSARLFDADPQVKAIGTSSAAVAASFGLPDGEHVRLEEIVNLTRAIVISTPKPVTVDLEAGYASEPDQVYKNVRSILEAGCSGFNLEDTEPDTGHLREPEHQASLIAAAAQAVRDYNPEAVLNARTDTYWSTQGTKDDLFAQTIQRLERYREAGASCVFVPGFPLAEASPLQASQQIKQLVGECGDCPVNLLATGSLPLTLKQLHELGIARISYGSSLYRVAMGQMLKIFGKISQEGFEVLAQADNLSYQQLKGVLEK